MAQTLRIVRLPILITLLVTVVVLFFSIRPFKNSGPSPELIIKEFSRLYHATYQVHQKTTWGGIKIQQTPTDMWAIQEIIVAQKPDFLIETGTLKGGSALYFATVFHAFHDTGRVITVNIVKETDVVESLPVFREHVIEIIGDAAAPETINRIATIVQGHRALVMVDDLHTWQHVLKELPLYAPFVQAGGYLIVNDTNFGVYSPDSRFPNGGPLRAVREFLKTHPEFVSDRTLEKFLLTYYPMGYLRRVR